MLCTFLLLLHAVTKTKRILSCAISQKKFENIVYLKYFLEFSTIFSYIFSPSIKKKTQKTNFCAKKVWAKQWNDLISRLRSFEIFYTFLTKKNLWNEYMNMALYQYGISPQWQHEQTRKSFLEKFVKMSGFWILTRVNFRKTG